MVSDSNCQSGKINSNYQLVTPDGISHDIQSQDVILPKGLDAAIIKFNSKNLYQLATIGQYNIPLQRRQWVFVSGFPGELNGIRKFTPGYRFQQEKGLSLLLDQQKLEIDISGYELVYSNLSYPGMSGGPVLDTKGHVIGINTGQEGETISATEIRQLGYAFGVPSTTLLGFAKDKNVNTTSFTISNQTPTPLNENDLKSLKKHPAFVVEKPPSNASENDWLNYGNKLWRLERVTEAISAFKTAIKLNPNLAEAYYALGMAYDEQEKEGTDLNAIEAFDKVIALDSNWHLTGQAWYQKAIILHHSDKSEEALVAINKGIERMELLYDDDGNEDDDDKPKFYRQQARILQELQRYPDAITALNQAMEIAPSGISYFTRGFVYSQMGEFQKALNDCNQALELGLIEGYFCQGLVYNASANYEQSINAYNQAIELDSTNSIYYQLRGIAYTLSRNYPKAIADFTKAIELTPQDHSLYNSRANIYSGTKQFELAVKDISKAIALKPDNAQYYYERAYAKNMIFNIQLMEYSSKGGDLKDMPTQDYESVLQDVNKAIQLNPNHAKAYALRGTVHSANIRTNIHQELNEVLSNPNLTDTEKRKKFIEIAQSHYPKAIADYNKAVELRPMFGSVYYFRGMSWSEFALLSNKKDELMQNALNDYNKAIELINDPNPLREQLWTGWSPEEFKGVSLNSLKSISRGFETRYASVYKSRGDLLLQMKDNQGALADYTEAIKLEPEQVALYQQRSLIYRQLNEPQKAIADATKVIELTPDDPNSYFSRGVIYHSQKDYKQAMNDYNLALSKDNTFITAINNIGLIDYEQDNPEKAIQQWQKAINIKEDFAEVKLALAVVFYDQGEQDKAFSLAKDAIKSNKRWKDVDYLKQNLWGEKLIKDAQLLLETPPIKQL